MGRRVRVQGMVTFCSVNVSTVLLGEDGVPLLLLFQKKPSGFQSGNWAGLGEDKWKQSRLPYKI